MSPIVETKPNGQQVPAAKHSAVTFQDMLDGIKLAFGRLDCMVDIDEIWQILESYQSDPREWAKYVFYDMRKYKRNLVYAHEKYNVMIIGWGPNAQSSIHDHSGSHCFMKVLDGELIESRFAWPDQRQIQNGGESPEMRCPSEGRMSLNEVQYINDKVGLHRVDNPNLSKTSASLHVYIPPFRMCKAFDERTGQSRDCKLTFYSKQGNVVKEDEDAA